MTRSELLQAIARGWCHTLNEHKEMDTDLADAIATEVLAILSAPEPRPEGVPEFVYFLYFTSDQHGAMDAWPDSDGSPYRYRFDGIVETGERGE